MANTQIYELAQKIFNQDKKEIKENNQPVRDYSKAELMVFALAKKNLDTLEQALKDAIASEVDCAKIMNDVQPLGDNYNKYYRIAEIISRYDGAWKTNSYSGKAPKTTRSVIDPLPQIKEFK